MSEFTGQELATELGISIQTLYAWIRAGALRQAPIQRTGGPGRGGRRTRWTHDDHKRALKVKELRASGVPLSEIPQRLGAY